MIGVSGDGHQFPPFLIWKGSTGRSGRILVHMKKVAAQQQITLEGSFEGFPLSSFYSVQPKAWMDSVRMLEWIEKVWKPWTATKNGKPTLLVMDEFSAHMTTAVRNAIADCGSYYELIPGGYTSKLQAMDVGLNKPFKNHIRDQYDDWCLNRDETTTTKPLRTDVSQWVHESWHSIESAVISNTWHHIGLFPDGGGDSDGGDHTMNSDDENVYVNMLVDDNEDDDDDALLAPVL